MAESKKKRKIVERVKNAILYSDGSIKISNVRWSFPHVVEPYESTNDAGKKVRRYKIVGMLPKKTHGEAYDLVMDRIDELLKENKVKALPAGKKFCRDGDEEERDEYDGHWIVSASEKTRPTLRQWDEDEGKGVLCDMEDESELEGMFYGGAWGSIWVNPWFQNSKEYGKRVNANLWGVMFRAHDEAYGQGKISEEEGDEAFADEDDYDYAKKKGGGSSSSGRSKKGSDYEDDEDDDRGSSRRKRSRDDDEDSGSSRRSSSSRRSRSDDDNDDPDDL